MAGPGAEPQMNIDVKQNQGYYDVA
jgi:hypothetical protein